MVANGGLAAAAPQPGALIYASASGSGSGCSSFRPCSLATAQAKARQTAALGSDVTVRLAGGTYQLSSPLAFTSADSGVNGHRVTYQAGPGPAPVLSGGRTVTGWTQYDASKNIWVASVPGVTATRELYVNGRRATLASAPASTIFGTLTPTSTGYQTSNTASLSPWTKDADQPDLLMPGAPFTWSESVCGLTSVSGNSVTVASTCLQNLTHPWQGYTSPPGILAAPGAYVENNLSLLTQPGQFFASTASGQIYYIPRAGEDVNRSSVVAPQLNSLVTATGVSNLTFSGINFAYAAWVPSTTLGMVDSQSNFYEITNTNPTPIPAAVAFTGSTNVVFSRNTLTHLGGAGVSFDAGGSNNQVIGNAVTDVSSTGISLSSPLFSPESGDQVVDNYVNKVSIGYAGGLGIFVGAASHTTVAHNDVGSLPGNGISLGWGWSNPTGQTDNHVDYNRIHDINQSALYDGGAIYLNGAESGGASNSSAVGNYISGDPQPWGAIYLESGASNTNVSGNVVSQAGTNWVFLQVAAQGTPANNNTISGNYTDTPPSTECMTVSTDCAANATVDPSNTFTNNSTGLTSWPAGATSIIGAAGLEPAYAAISGGPISRNLSFGTPATASSTDAASAPASAANDGTSSSSWTSAAGAGGDYWQTDLGSAHALSGIQVMTNQVTSIPSTLSNFEVVVSNSPITASTPGTIVCTVGAPGLAYQGIADCPAPPGTWRYVGVVATGAQQLSLAEVRAFGS